MLIDRDHLVTELYAISNVPTLVWIDPDGRIARPNSVGFGTDMFVDFHNTPSGPYKDLVRSWVLEDEVDLSEAEATGAVDDLSDEEVDARLHFRLGSYLREVGDESGAAEHFERAEQLAPFDFTIARAAMPLTGRDPFGEEFFDLYGRWEAAGSPYHGIKQTPGS